jgi:methionyl-tRNA formyltransferase
MRVAFLTNLTTRVNLAVLEALVASEHAELVHVYFFDTIAAARRSPWRLLKQFGVRRLTGKLLHIAYDRVVKFFPISPTKGGLVRKRSTCWELAIDLRLPHSRIENINATAAIEHLKELRVELLVVCVCKNILKAKVLGLPNLKIINIHPSILPSYRGPAPTFWMLRNGEKKTGATIHLVTEQIDAGPILDQFTLPLDHSKSEGEIESEIFQIAAVRLAAILQKFPDFTYLTPLPDIASTYFGYPTG